MSELHKRARQFLRRPPADFRCTVDEADAGQRLGHQLLRLLTPLAVPGHPLRLLCIGTDRSTGDSLGPLIGRALGRLDLPGVRVYGTLDEPVHASNLAATLEAIRQEGEPGVTVAIDACLGKLENVGSIAAGLGSLRPGAGVNKNLPEVGDVYITGTVNVGGFMEYFVLQNTRLSLVMRMAETIVEGLTLAVRGLSFLPADEASRRDSAATSPVR